MLDGMLAAPCGGMENDHRDPQTYAIIGAAMEVHRELGCGYLEPVYVEALEIELRIRRIPYRREVSLPITYKGQVLKKFYRVDFICHDEVLVELKALHSLGPIEEAQLINYLCASKRQRGLLLNFGTRSLQYRRRVWQYAEKAGPLTEIQPGNAPCNVEIGNMKCTGFIGERLV